MIFPPSGITAKLHSHLDGERPLLDILPQMWHLTHGMAKRYPLDIHSDHHGQVKKWFGNPLKGDIVKKFSLTTGVMQDLDTIMWAAYNYVELRARQGFRYCEMIIAPQYMIFGGLTVRQVVEALIRGIKRAEVRYPWIEVDILLAIGREISSNEAVELVVKFGQCEGLLCWRNLVCDEAKHPPEKHKSAMNIAKLSGFKTACHAGEWVHDPDIQEPNFYRDYKLLLKNCWTAINELKVDRLEHAIPLAYDNELTKVVVDKGIGVTSCPGSYLCSELLPNNDLGILRLDKSLDAGVLLAIDSDDDLFMKDLDEVFDICCFRYKFSDEHIEKLKINPWKIRFGNRKPVPESIALYL